MNIRTNNGSLDDGLSSAGQASAAGNYTEIEKKIINIRNATVTININR